jgi:MFS superfamily sulfate permease-like transporter
VSEQVTKVETKTDPSAYSFPGCLKYDVVSGFLVFLIALPLCLGIAKASGYPPVGGVITAIVGGILASLISNSELTIKGPAAGLIAIVAGCVTAFGGTFGSDPVADALAYKAALAVGVVAAVIQILFGLLRAGKLGDFFPTAAVHGLLASIGVLIMIKQFLNVLGVAAKQPREATELIFDYPHLIMHGTDGTDAFNLPIAVIGLVSLAIMIIYPMIKVKALKAIPVQLIVLIVAIPMAMVLNVKQPGKPPAAAALPAPGIKNVAFAAEEKAEAKIAAAKDKEAKPAAGAHDKKPAAKEAVPLKPGHTYEMGGKEWRTNPDKFLINVPDKFFPDAFAFPDFSAFNGKWGTAIYWIVMFSVIASLESLLSAKAVDLIDPLKRKTDLNRDLLGCGIANLVASAIGGLPMISEIVRSRANVDNGAKTRFSNLSHGLFLLVFVALLPFVVKMIPVSALAAMLVFTGFRLAHPREFVHMYKIGIEQFIVFVTTIIAIVCTDLLVGAIIGMVLELVINVFSGLPITSIFSCSPDVRQQNENTFLIVPHKAAVFSNWLGLRAKIEEYGLKQKKNLVIDLSDTQLVDHTVMEKLHEMERDFRNNNLTMEIVGLDKHTPVSSHPAAARKFAA